MPKKPDKVYRVYSNIPKDLPILPGEVALLGPVIIEILARLNDEADRKGRDYLLNAPKAE